MTCLQTDGDYRIKFPESNTFHRISVSNPFLLFKLIQKRSLSLFVQRHYIGNLGFAAADDIIIAIAMVYLLRSRRTGVKRYC